MRRKGNSGIKAETWEANARSVIMSLDIYTLMLRVWVTNRENVKS